MTDKPTPTDAEILDAAEDFRSQYTHGGTTFDEFDEIGFARAVLAKWGGSEAQAAAPIKTLEEAIAHAEDKAKGNSACAMEHAKLAAWLTELQLLRAAQAAPVDAENEIDLLAEAALCERLDACLAAARAAQKEAND